MSGKHVDRNFSRGPARLLRVVAANTALETTSSPAFGFIANDSGNVRISPPDQGEAAVVFPVLRGRFYPCRLRRSGRLMQPQ